jgi:hypothetical protein
VYGDTGVAEVEFTTQSIYRGDGGGMSHAEYEIGRIRSRLSASHFHLILSYNENKHSIFPNFGSHLRFPRFSGSTQ